MRALLQAAVMSLLVVFSAAAEPVYSIGGMSCSEIQARLQRNGSAVLRWRSKNDMPLYGRYVSDRRFCWPGEVVTFATVPASDRSCTVKKCVWRMPTHHR